MANQDSTDPFTMVSPPASGRNFDSGEARGASFWAKTILIWLLQVVGVSSAIVFGMFSTLAWQNSEIAKSQADAANLLSMVALCAQLDGPVDERYRILCDSVKVAAHDRLYAMVVSMFGTLSETTASTTSSSPSTAIPSSIESPTSEEGSPPSITTSTWIPPFASQTPLVGTPGPSSTFTTSTSSGFTTTVSSAPTGSPSHVGDPAGRLAIADKIAIVVVVVTTVISLLSLIWVVPQIRAHNHRNKETSRG